ncbi:imine reductase family protein [Amycolatopsis sp. CA-230715]|uniref:imine reductase family protein n=1 Tax=Amycolatopsis sp. CA-230715 TaxID=2745196 RepID=UPI001C023741|nr:NAD(P)-dependent oxidoreductase [Amycolatopsis sp. CA-230715]QWF80036.1 hypothetical protein HUW46_03451 [Amycolatopsis sp. CA-230715]
MSSPNRAPVTVLGANPRGAAIAGALARAGHAVTLLDPAGRPEPGTVPDGVATAGAPESAPAGNLVVLCAEDYDALWRLLDRFPDPDALVNLTSGTSEQARAAASGRTEYLDGALMAHPEHVGDDGTVLVYSGSEEAFRRHEDLLSRLGRATYLGADAGTAALYDLAMLNFAWATLLGYLQTAALLGTAGVPARTLTPLLTHWLSTTIADVIADYGGQIDAKEYPGDGEWLELDAPLMTNLVRATENSGLHAALPRLIESLTAEGIAAGLGKQSFASLVEVIRPRAA